TVSPDSFPATTLGHEEVAMTAHNHWRSGQFGAVGSSRRTFLERSGALALAAASGVPLVSVASAQSRTLKIGFIGAQSGIRANFGETTAWTIERMQAVVKDGLKV